MKFQHFFLLLFMFFAVHFNLLCQPAYYTFSHIDAGQNLSQNSVYCMQQDAKGYLWIGTGDGLNRFDGYSCKVFRNVPGDNFSISNNVIRSILPDSEGKIWIGTEDGLNSYNPETNRFTRYYFQKKKYYAERVLCEDEDDNLWIWAQGNGLIKFEKNRKRAELFYLDGYINNYNSTPIYNSSEKCFWFLLNQGLTCFDIKERKFRHYSSSNKTVAESYNSISQYNDSLLILCAAGQLEIFNTNSRQFIHNHPLALIKKSAYGLRGLLVAKPFIWIGTYGDGIYLYQETQKKIIHFSAENRRDELKSNLITFLFKGKNNIIWAGTDGGGAAMVNGINNKFNKISISPHNDYNIRERFIRSLLSDSKSRLWVGTQQSGVDKVNINTGEVVHIAGIGKANIISLIEDQKRNIWAATYQNLYIYSEAEKCFMPHPASKLVQDRGLKIIKIIQRKNGDILIASTQHGVFKLIDENNEYALQEIEGFGSKNTFTIFEDSKGNLWKAGASIECLQGNKAILLPEMLVKTAQNVKVTAFCEDGNNNIWMATKNGLIRYDVLKKTIRTFLEKDGLPNNYIYEVQAYKNKYLWIASNKGLSKLDLQNFTFRNYDLSDGLQSYEFNGGAASKGKDGTLYFGGINGINYFDPSLIQDDTFKAQVNITDFAVNDSIANLHTLSGYNHKITLAHNKNYLYFELAGSDIRQAGQNKFAYVMKGLDTSWHVLGTQRYLRFTGLQPGEYQLQIKATNADGVWSDKTTDYNISIAPPYWATWWFRVLASAGFIGVCLAIVYWYLKQKFKQKLAELEKIRAVENIRSRISRDIHDEIGSSLTKILILSERIKSKITHKEVNEIVEKLTSQSREIVSNLGEIVWNINPQYDNLESFMAYVRSYVTEYLEGTTISSHFCFPENIPVQSVTPDQRRNLFLVIKEALNNIVKHACADSVTITLSVKENAPIVLKIRDNGHGCKNFLRTGGNGIESMKMRIKSINGNINIQSAEGIGTEIEIMLDLLTNTTFV